MDGQLPFDNFVKAAFRLRCPYCLEGQVFEGWFGVRRQCSSCGFFYSRESGFFGGSIYFGYAVTIMVAVVVGFIVGYVFGQGWSIPTLAVVLLVTILFPIWFFRYARILWMCMDLYMNPPVKEDFTSRGR